MNALQIDSVQKRLGEIVYVQCKPDHMVSRQGKHLEAARDRVQMMNIAENMALDEDGVKTYDQRQHCITSGNANNQVGRKQRHMTNTKDDID